MLSLAQKFDQAVKLHQAGDLNEAEKTYRDILEADPHHVHALQLLGLLCFQSGRHEPAFHFLVRAVRLKPDVASAHYNLANVLRALGRLDEAAASYRLALHYKHDYPEANNNLGSTLKAQGKLDDAAAHYREALRLKPAYGEAHNNLGITLLALRQLDEAAAHLREAVRLRPDSPDIHCNLGNVLKAQGKVQEAAGCYERAVRLKPDAAEAHNNLGSALMALGQFDGAAASFRDALRFRTDYPEALNNLGVVLLEQGKMEESAACLRQAVLLRPDSAEAQCNLGNVLKALGQLDEANACYEQALQLRPTYVEALNNLGSTLKAQNKLDEAIARYRQAIQIRPDYAEAQNNLGVTLLEQGKPAEAEPHYREALRLKPAYAEVHLGLGAAVLELGRPEEATACYHEALRLKPTYAEAYNNLGSAQMALGKLPEAIVSYTEAVRLRQDYAEAHHNRAMAWLLAGDFEQGWVEYEWRWKCKKWKMPPFPQPLWDGSDLAGRTILLHIEQGIGDTVMFLRYPELVKQRGGTVLMACPETLERLFRGARGVDRLVPRGSPMPQFDVHAPMLSLPRMLGLPHPESANTVPYLAPEPDLVASWARDLSQYPGFKVGIAWQGNPKYANDRHRSIPLRFFAPLARAPGVRLLSLQKGHGSEQVPQVDFPVIDLAQRLDETTGGFVDTVAALRSLDLVITSDTAVAHIAGALGVPVWTALTFAPDWRWQLGREDSPWYPTMRLFRQSSWGDWAGLFERITGELGKLVPAGEVKEEPPAPAEPARILVELAPGDLFDRITRLEVEGRHVREPAAAERVRRELAALEEVRARSLPASAQLDALTAELRAAHEALWLAEDELRWCESRGEWGLRLVDLAREMFRQGERRAALKRQMDELVGAELEHG
jgi:tetratricopeptide (TPR) repeat protein